ncbi:MAG: hypothetical protein IJU91_04910, partial [Selenomonadaceae bacterium]|nr:hypothetical protein [Selenomonadaceae bacterium]
MLIKPSKLVGTLEELQAALNNPDISDITINSTIFISENTVIDFHGKRVTIVLNFSRSSVFILDAEGIELTFKSSTGSGGIVPVRLNQDVALIQNDNINNTVTFDAGFNVDYSESKNFNIIKSSKKTTLNFSGANIKNNKLIWANRINISGGSITCTSATAIYISKNGTFNMSGGKVQSTSENNVGIVIGDGVKANIFGGTAGSIRINGDGASLKISSDAKIIDDRYNCICIYISEESTNVSIEMSGGSIESGYIGINNSSVSSKINITGGTISANDNGIYSKGSVNITGGEIISKGT